MTNPPEKPFSSSDLNTRLEPADEILVDKANSHLPLSHTTVQEDIENLTGKQIRELRHHLISERLRTERLAKAINQTLGIITDTLKASS